MSGANVARADMFVRNRGDKATGRAIRTRCASSRGLAELDKYGHLSRWNRQPTVPRVTAFEQPANTSRGPLAVGGPTEDGRRVTREQGASQPAGRT
jgi:hypothetical protein